MGLDITAISANQAQKEVTANEGFDILEGACSLQATHDMASDANYTLDTSTGDPPYEWQHAVIHITDTGVVLTAGRDIIVPDEEKISCFRNATAQTLTLKTSGGTGIAVAAGNAATLFCDGTNVVRLTADV